MEELINKATVVVPTTSKFESNKAATSVTPRQVTSIAVLDPDMIFPHPPPVLSEYLASKLNKLVSSTASSSWWRCETPYFFTACLEPTACHLEIELLQLTANKKANRLTWVRIAATQPRHLSTQ